MIDMLLEVCHACRRYFIVSGQRANFTIANHILSGFTINHQIGAYLYIERANMAKSGSMVNEGIYRIEDRKITLTDAKNEEWHGNIYLCSFPPDFLRLVDEITEAVNTTSQTGGTVVSENNSGSGYSYALALNRDGVPASWQEIYASRLKRWRIIQ